MSEKPTHTKSTNQTVGLIALYIIIVSAFGLFNKYTFWFSDDYAIGYDATYGGRFDSIAKIVKSTIVGYFHWSGAFIPTFLGHLFCGYFTSKTIFNIANTICFGVFIYYGTQTICLINHAQTKHSYLVKTLLFSTMWYLCCPVPCETMFWVAGSLNYLWNTTLSLIFLYYYLKYKNTELSFFKITILSCISFFAGTTHVLSSAAISASLILYTIFHYKELKNSTYIMTIAFLAGTLFLYIAPGNYERFNVYYNMFNSFNENFKYCIHARILTFSQYRAVYLFCICLLILRIYDKKSLKNLWREQEFMLLLLGFSVLAFSVVFGPALRAAIFPELIATFLTIYLLLNHLTKRMLLYTLILLSICCTIDYTYALHVTIDQDSKNEQLINSLKKNNGEACFETIPSPHRMTNPIRIDSWSRYGLCQMYNLEKIITHPIIYCKKDRFDEFCSLENYRPQIHTNAFLYENYIILKYSTSMSGKAPIKYTLEYEMPRLWHRTLRNFLGLFDYKRQISDISYCAITIDNFDYYIIKPAENKHESVTSIQTSFD